MFELLELFSNESTSPHPSVKQDNKGELKSGNCYKSTDWKCHRYTGWLLIVDIWNKLHKKTHSLCSLCLLKVQVDCQWWSGIQPSAMEATHLCIFTLTSGDYKSPPQFKMHHSANLLFNHTKIFIGTSEIPYFWV